MCVKLHVSAEVYLRSDVLARKFFDILLSAYFDEELLTFLDSLALMLHQTRK